MRTSAQQSRDRSDWPLQAIAELNRADAVALSGEAVILADGLARPICSAGELGGLDVIAAGGDCRQRCG
jgi:hypothetical protein